MARLVRLVVVKFSSSHDGHFRLGADDSLPRVDHVRELRKDGKTLGDLYAAHVESKVALRDGFLAADEAAIDEAEHLLEVGSRSVALSRRQGVSHASPIPYVGLDLTAEPGLVPDVIASEYPPVRQVISPNHDFPLDRPEIWRRLLGRPAAVALLSDAFSTTGAPGRLALVMRFFEYALASSQKHLAKALAGYASATGRGFDETEARRWTAIRPGVAHPNLGALRSAELSPELILPRVEELALDVLVNKRDVPSDDPTRDVLWEPPSGGSSATTADIFLTQGQEASIEVRMTDAFGTYPMNLAGPLEGTGVLERIHWLTAPGEDCDERPLVARWVLGN
jgi:hypothetical protein